MDLKYQIWLDPSLRDQVYSNFPFDQSTNMRVLSKQDEGNVYQLANIVIKQRKEDWSGDKVCQECIRREFEVGRILNQLESPHLVRTYGYFETTDESYLVLSYVAGQSLYQTKSSITLKEYYKLIYHLLLIVLDLQARADFTHYDLHFSNIVVTPIPATTYSYLLYGQTYTVTSNYHITLIDFARSHVRGIRPMFCETAGLAAYNAPGVFDDQIDLTFIVRSMNSIAPLPNDIFQPLVENGVLEVSIDPAYDIKLYDNEYMLGLLFQNGKGWSANTSNGLTRYQLTEQIGEYLLQLAYARGITDEQLASRTDFPPEQKYRRLTLANAVCLFDEDILPAEQLDHFIKQMGQSVVHDKLQTLTLRIHSTLTLFSRVMQLCLDRSN